MTIANVTLNDTFDDWRTKTNQIIVLYDETNALARASYNATNLATVTAANLAANVLASNAYIIGIITNTVNTTTNSIAPNIITSNNIIMTTLYNYANSVANSIAYNYVSNTSFVLAYNQANTSYNIAQYAANTANYANAGTVGIYGLGNQGRVGNTSAINHIFKITTPYLNANSYFSSAENSFAVGPIYLANNVTLQINSGARVVII
jgi:hypothetical protein